MDILIQVGGLLLLLGGMAFGYFRWVHPHPTGKGLLLLTVLTLMGGFIGALGWWFDDPRSFSWDLPPLASRMLASAGWAFAAATFMALQKPLYGRLRLVMLMLAVYLAPLTVVIVMAHLDRFDWNVPITYAFFIIVLTMMLPALYFLFRMPVISGDDTTPAPRTISLFLTAVAVIMTVWGLLLFITDNGGSDLIWVWPGDLLTSRLIAVMLLTIAAGSAYSLRYADRSRVMLVTIFVYGIGVSAANLYNLVADRPVKWSYVAAFLMIAVISAITLTIENKVKPSKAENPF